MAPPPKNHSCTTCGRSFSRSEHLDRHCRIHTREKPYACGQCTLCFSRPDLRRRHEIIHHPETQADSERDPSAEKPSLRARKRQRTKVACDNCNARKLKCDSERPCGRCRASNVECTSSSERSAVRQENDARLPVDPPDPHEPSQTYQFQTQETTTSSPTAVVRQPLENSFGDGDGGSRFRPPSVSNSQAPGVLSQSNLSLDANAQEFQWTTDSYSSSVGAAQTLIVVAAADAVAAPESAARYVHFSPQTQMSAQEFSNTSSLPMEFDFDFASLGQNDQTSHLPSFYDQEGLSNLFPGFNMSYESFPICNATSEGGHEYQVMDFDTDDAFEASFFPLQDMFPNTTPSQDDPDPSFHTNHAASIHITASANLSSDAHSRFEALTDLNMSRPPSPPLLKQRNIWIAELGKEDSSAYLMDDKTVIDEFLWLFQDRVSGWFSCFRNVEVKITVQTQRAWYLAMAAVGALFCRADGSNKIAKWLYHCARQKLFSFVYGKKAASPTVSDGIWVVETYMMLQLFGYLSGDKRLYELTEAIHGQMIQTLIDLDLLRPNPLIPERKRQDLIESLLTFDCYRVVLIQRPPGLQLFLTLAKLKPASLLSTGVDDSDNLADYLRAFTCPGSLSDTFQSTSGSYGLLCSLAAMTWNVVPPPFSSESSSNTLWSTSFCELALNQWFSTHDTPPSNNVMMLFHAIHINMLVCLPMVQNLVVSYLNRSAISKKSSPRNRQTQQPSRLPEVSALREIFSNPQHRPKAVWHARRTLELAQRSLDGSENISRSSKDQELEDATNIIVEDTESPHFSHCVTFAVLVLWCDTMLSSGQNEQISSRWPEIGIKVLEDPEGDCSRIKGLFRSIFVDMVACATSK